MHKIPLTRVPGGFSQDSFPDAVARLTLTSYEAQHFADLVLHLEDLTFSGLCLQKLLQGAVEPLIRDALWMSALVSFFKCFGEGRRVRLLSREVYSDKPGADKFFEYYKAVRDGRIAHDGNAQTKGMPFAYLNHESVQPKIAAVTATIMATATDPNDYLPMLALTQDAMLWCNKTANRLRNELMQQLEAMDYAELAKLKECSDLPDIGGYKHAFKGRPSTNAMKNKK